MCERKSRCTCVRDMRTITLYVTARLITGDLSETIAIDGGEGCVETEREQLRESM